VAVRFCGGCNPEFERGDVARRIQEELAGAVPWVPRDEEKDFLVVINGCKTACAEMPEREKGIPAVIICGEAVFSEFDP